MNQKLNAWLCKHFDRTKVITDEYFGNEKTVPKKGYVTLWDIIEIAIIKPFFIIICISSAIICALLIPAVFTDIKDIKEAILFGLMFWAAIVSIYIICRVLKWMTSYKVAICPLVTEKKSKEYSPDIPSSEKEIQRKKYLKDAEKEMFDDILKKENQQI